MDEVETIVITVLEDEKVKMIHSASQEVNRVLSGIVPPFNHDKDIVKLRKYVREQDCIELTYEILRDARRSKAEQNRSPYREKGLIMKVGRNS
jgi:hypothetical protein